MRRVPRFHQVGVGKWAELEGADGGMEEVGHHGGLGLAARALVTMGA